MGVPAERVPLGWAEVGVGCGAGKEVVLSEVPLGGVTSQQCRIV